MRRARVGFAAAFVIFAASCQDKARDDYDWCMERQRAFDVAGAYSACAAAVAADPRSVSGQAAAKEIDTNLKPVHDKLVAERDEKAAREAAIKKEEPPPPPMASVAVTAAPVDVPPMAQAQGLYDSGDAGAARAILYPRVMGTTKGAPDEAQLLKTICKAQKDKACLMALAKKYH